MKFLFFLPILIALVAAIPQTPSDSLNCFICEDIAKFVLVALQNNETVENIVNYLSKACDAIPNPWNKDCIEFVKDEVPALIAMLVAGETPDGLCQELGFCDSSDMRCYCMKKRF